MVQHYQERDRLGATWGHWQMDLNAYIAFRWAAGFLKEEESLQHNALYFAKAWQHRSYEYVPGFPESYRFLSGLRNPVFQQTYLLDAYATLCKKRDSLRPDYNKKKKRI